jgi:hypothetical protein
MNRVIKVLLLTILPIFTLAAQKDALRLQPWHPPTAAQLGSAEEQKWRDGDPAHYLSVTGDFDGDGKPDEARIMVRGDGKGFAIFVKLGASPTPVKIEELPDITKLRSMGIKLVPPAEYPTACARGLDCAEDEPRYIRVKHSAIDFFQPDVADRYYYWDDARHTFANVGING